MEQEKINHIKDLMKDGKNDEIKKLVAQGLDIHFSNDYLLYLSVWTKNKYLQQYFIGLGLDPEVTKGRLAIAYPEDFTHLRVFIREKEIKENADRLNNNLPDKACAYIKKLKL